MHPSNKVTLENVEQIFHYRRPTPETIPKFEAINAAALGLAKAILENAPECADRTAAIRLVTQARMQANAAIATAEPEEPPTVITDRDAIREFAGGATSTESEVKP